MEIIRNLAEGQVMIILVAIGIIIYFATFLFLEWKDKRLQIHLNVFKKVVEKRGYQFNYQQNLGLSHYANSLIAVGVSGIATIIVAIILMLIRHWK